MNISFEMLEKCNSGMSISITLTRVVPDTDLVGYPDITGYRANSFAGYRISGLPDNRISD